MTACAQMRAETANALAAVQWSVAHDRAEVALRILEGWACLSQLPAAAESIQQTLTNLSTRTSDPLTRARISLLLGLMGHYLNRPNGIIELLDAALPQLRAAGPPRHSTVTGEVILATAYADAGQLEQARRWAEKAMRDTAPQTEGTVPTARAAALGGAGYVARLAEDTLQAKAYLQEAWTASMNRGDLRGLALTGGDLGAVLLDAGRPDDAQAVARRTLDIAQELELANTASIAMGVLGGAALLNGDQQTALTCGRRSALMSDQQRACEDITAGALAVMAAALAAAGDAAGCARLTGVRANLLKAADLEFERPPLFVRPYLDAAMAELGSTTFDAIVDSAAREAVMLTPSSGRLAELLADIALPATAEEGGTLVVDNTGG